MRFSDGMGDLCERPRSDIAAETRKRSGYGGNDSRPFGMAILWHFPTLAKQEKRGEKQSGKNLLRRWKKTPTVVGVG